MTKRIRRMISYHPPHPLCHLLLRHQVTRPSLPHNHLLLSLHLVFLPHLLILLHSLIFSHLKKMKMRRTCSLYLLHRYIRFFLHCPCLLRSYLHLLLSLYHAIFYSNLSFSNLHLSFSEFSQVAEMLSLPLLDLPA